MSGAGTGIVCNHINGLKSIIYMSQAFVGVYTISFIV